MRSITVSLPVKNLKVSAAFFTELGFSYSPGLSGPDSVCMVIDQHASVVLVTAERYRDRVNDDANCAGSAGEVLLRLSADSEREADEIVMKAIVAGARPWPVTEPVTEPATGPATGDQPGYSGSFLDPDGHLWQVTCPRDRARPEPAVTIAA